MGEGDNRAKIKMALRDRPGTVPGGSSPFSEIGHSVKIRLTAYLNMATAIL